MNLSILDYYLVGINVLGFFIFIPYVYFFAPIGNEKANIFDKILTIISICFGSLGLLISILIFGRTPKEDKKSTMMSRIFIWSVLVIQIIIVLIIKGNKYTNVTLDFINYFKEYKILFIYIVSINILTFIIYAYDKLVSIYNKRRISIVTLLFLSFIGGSVGALLSMYLFRHKTSKDYFVEGVALTLLMHIFILFYLINL